jgi:hypothetical protein
VADQGDSTVVNELPARSERARASLPARDVVALATALLFVLFGFAAIYITAKVADVKDGAVLAVVLIVPALLYLMLSGRVNELKGPAGLEVRLSEVAKQTIPAHGKDTGALAYEELRAVETGRGESFFRRVQDVMPQEPVILTLTLGSSIDGAAAATYAKGLKQFPRFRFVAIVDSEQHGRLISYMEESAFRHLMDADIVDTQELINNIRQKNVGAIRTFPGMIVTTVTPQHSIADALREMQRLRLSALLVTEQGLVEGIVERDRLANALLLSLIDRPSG